jgi:hypothetical protein
LKGKYCSDYWKSKTGVTVRCNKSYHLTALDLKKGIKDISTNNKICSNYTYSTCPSTCEKVCVSSSCNRMSCTADCDGP